MISILIEFSRTDRPKHLRITKRKTIIAVLIIRILSSISMAPTKTIHIRHRQQNQSNKRSNSEKSEMGKVSRHQSLPSVIKRISFLIELFDFFLFSVLDWTKMNWKEFQSVHFIAKYRREVIHIFRKRTKSFVKTQWEIHLNFRTMF